MRSGFPKFVLVLALGACSGESSEGSTPGPDDAGAGSGGSDSGAGGGWMQGGTAGSSGGGASGAAAGGAAGSSGGGSPSGGGAASGGAGGAVSGGSGGLPVQPGKDPYPSEAIPLAKCGASTMQWWKGAGSRDVTFVAFGDSQAADMAAGCSPDAQYASNQNTLQRQAINGIGAHVWPAGASFFQEGAAYDHVRGVIVAGDLTQNGSDARPVGTQLGHDCLEYTQYRAAYGRCGDEGKLAFPVYDAYGNHDFPWIAGAGDANYHPVIDYLDQITAAHRPGPLADLYDDPAPGTAHYAWRWDDVWFVNLDVKPGIENEPIPKDGATRIVSPLDSLGFFKSFLGSRSASTTRQVVVITHYPIGSSRITDNERLAFCKLVANAQNGTGAFPQQKLAKANPLVYIHGHTHDAPQAGSYQCPAPYGSVQFPIFDVGTPFYKDAKNGPGRLHFTVFRIGTNRVEAAGVSADANAPSGGWTYTHKTRLDVMNPP